eukprot:455362_1
MSTYTWKLTDPSLVRHIKNAKNKSEWSSPTFSGGGFRWYLDFRPNRHTNKSMGYAVIFLCLASLPPKVKSVQVRKELHLIETNSVANKSNAFEKGHMSWGWNPTQLQT